MTAPPVPTPEQARAVLAAQPFSRHLGADLSVFGDGAATIEVPLRQHHLQQGGVAHGGLLAYAADNAMTFAGGSVLGPHVLTASMTIDYVAPARGDLLRAEARVSHRGDRQAVCHCTVRVRRGDAWEVCAVAQGLIRTPSRPLPHHPGGPREIDRAPAAEPDVPFGTSR